jgi:hypothetical protein
MEDSMNGVFNKATGLLLRAGFCDFTTDPGFNPEIEEQKDGLYPPVYILNEIPPKPASEFVTHWNGESWDEVPRIEFIL